MAIVSAEKERLKSLLKNSNLTQTDISEVLAALEKEKIEAKEKEAAEAKRQKDLEKARRAVATAIYLWSVGAFPEQEFDREEIESYVNKLLISLEKFQFDKYKNVSIFDFI